MIVEEQQPVPDEAPKPQSLQDDLTTALRGLLREWDRIQRILPRSVSPMMRASNEAVNFARVTLAAAEGPK